MKRTHMLLIAAVAVALILRVLATGPSPDQNSWENDLLAWRAKRAESLQAPEGWLSLIGIFNSAAPRDGKRWTRTSKPMESFLRYRLSFALSLDHGSDGVDWRI
jgi:hypothetical protein